MENIISEKFADKILKNYMLIAPEVQELSIEEQNLLKVGMEVEKFLYKATGGAISLADITIKNGKIEGVSGKLEKLLNQPGENQSLIDYRKDILAIKNYERMQSKEILTGFSVTFQKRMRS